MPGTSTGRRPTVKDVARQAGVSRQTVSNALNGTGRLAAATRERVFAAIRELGYEKHSGAASLRSGLAHRLAFVLPTEELVGANTVLVEFLQHLVTAAAARHRQVVVVAGGPEDTRAVDEVVRTGSVDAVVLSSLLARDPRITRLRQTGVPFVCFGRTGSGSAGAGGGWVDVDNRGAVRDVTQRLLAAGHRRVAFVGYDTHRQWDRDREAGYRDAMAQARRPARVVAVDRDAAGPLERLLAGRARPTAVVTGSDVLAAAAYAAGAARGLRIGTDLAVTGFDGSAVARLLAPTLTTVAMPLTAIAERLVEMAVGERPARGEVLATELVTGASTGPLPGSEHRRSVDPQPASHA